MRISDWSSDVCSSDLLACDRWYRAADNMVAIAKHIEAIRGMDRWGVGSIDQAFAGYQALPAPEQWFQVLGLRASATKHEVDVAYRNKARDAHPDQANGDHAKMQRINDAREDRKSTRLNSSH